MKELIWSYKAIQTIEEVRAFIGLGSQRMAQQWARSIIKRIEHLKRFPLQGRVIHDAGTTVRQVFFGDYRIVYEVHTTHLTVLIIRHTKRRFRRREIIIARDIFTNDLLMCL
jgi:toxin ParE1/3/4